MSGNSGISLAAGIVGGVVGFMIAGPAGALYGFSIGATAAGLILGPEAPEQTLKPEELRMTTSSESQTVPVIFGTSRLAGNHIGWDRDSFRTEEVYREPEAGKGGGTDDEVIGYHYYMSYAVGLCMGPVDELRKVSGSPGEDNVLFDEEEVKLSKALDITVATDRITGIATDFADFAVGMSVYVEGAVDPDNNRSRGTVTAIGGSGEYIELTTGTFQGSDETASSLELTSATTQAPISLTSSQTVTLTGRASDEGTCTIHPGNTTQTGPTINGVQLNYRHVCFAYFDDFQMGSQPSPRSYLWEVTRMPVCYEDNTFTGLVSGMITRGSNTSSDEEYYDANPAAVVWEVMTNNIWGKSQDPALFNEADFVAASIYYAENRIGISTSMSSGGIQDLLGKMRSIFGLAIWWDGDEVRCRVIWDRANSYSPRIRITDEDIIGSPVFNRGTISASINEIRVDFTNRSNLYQSETVTQQDLGAIEALGAVRQEKISASEIGTRRTAELLSARLLRELAYPPAQMQISVQRNFAHLDIGDFVELYWDAWRNSAGFTSFWRVQMISDDETGDNAVKLSLMEDIYATSRDGEISNFTAPIVTVEIDSPLDNDSFDTIDYTVGKPLGAITPILLDEAPIWISKGKRQIIVGIGRGNGTIQSFSAGWADPTILDYATLGIYRSFPISGTILDDVVVTGAKLVRNTSDHFRLSLTSATNSTALLSAASLVQDGTEHFSDLTTRSQNMLIINGEIFRVGFVEEDTPGEFTVKTAIRGELGTALAAHTTGDTFWFFPTWIAAESTIPASIVPIDTAVKIRFQPFAPKGSGDIVVVDGPDSLGFDGASIKPAKASLKEATRSSLTWTIHIRPVVYWGGMGYGPTFETEMLEELSIIDPLRIRIETSAGDSVTINEFFTTGSESAGNLEITKAEWIPSARGDKETGMIAITAVMTGSNPASVAIYQRLNGQESLALTINQPA